MWQPFTMFAEKDSAGVTAWSMTRVVAFLFALTFCSSMIFYALKASAIGWPFCVLGVVTVLAVPLQAMAKAIQAYLTTRQGQKLIGALLEKASGSVLSTAPITSVTTEVSTGGVNV